MGQDNEGGKKHVFFDGWSAGGGNDTIMWVTESSVVLRADKSGATLGNNFQHSVNIANIRNKWSHVVWRMTPTGSDVYLNGVLAGTINEPGSMVGFHDPLMIGAWFDTNVAIPLRDLFEGHIDDIRIYDRALSDAEVSELYDLEKPQPDLSPEEATADALNDSLSFAVNAPAGVEWTSKASPTG